MVFGVTETVIVFPVPVLARARTPTPSACGGVLVVVVVVPASEVVVVLEGAIVAVVAVVVVVSASAVVVVVPEGAVVAVVVVIDPDGLANAADPPTIMAVPITPVENAAPVFLPGVVRPRFSTLVIVKTPLDLRSVKRC